LTPRISVPLGDDVELETVMFALNVSNIAFSTFTVAPDPGSAKLKCAGDITWITSTDVPSPFVKTCATTSIVSDAE